MHEGRGVVAKLLVQNGTLRVGDIVVCGAAYGRVKAMYDTLQPRKTVRGGRALRCRSTSPAWTLPPAPATASTCSTDIAQARQLAEQRGRRAPGNATSAATQPHVTLENLLRAAGPGEQVQTLNIILRADVRGSIEAIRKELAKLEHPEVQIKILQATVGGITRGRRAPGRRLRRVIIGFNVVPDEKARALADKLGVQIRRYDIIYQVTDDLRAALEGMLKPEKREMDLGRALVQRTFHISRVGTVAGCRVLAGAIQRNARVRVIRESRVIGDYALGIAEAREGRCPRGPRGAGMRHEAGRLQRHQGRRRARSLQDRGDRPNVLESSVVGGQWPVDG